MSQPQDEFIKILYKINDIYSKLFKGYDLQDEIEHFNSKKKFNKKELTKLKNKCETEWKLLLSRICKAIINKIDKNKFLSEKLPKQYKHTKRIQSKINNNDLSLDKYEKIYDEIDDIIDDIKIENNTRIRTFKDRLIDWIIGFGIGVVISIIIYYLELA